MNTKRLSSNVELLFWNATIDVLSGLQKVRQYSQETSISVKTLQRRDGAVHWAAPALRNSARGRALKPAKWALSHKAILILVLVGLLFGFLIGYWNPGLLF